MDKNAKQKNICRLRALAALRVLMAALGAAAVCYGGALPSQAQVEAVTGPGASAVYSAAVYIRLALGGGGLAGCVAFAALLALYRRIYVQRSGRMRLSGFVLAAILALLTLTGLSMDRYGDLSLFGGRFAQWCVAEVVVAGYVFVYHGLLTLLYRFAEARLAAPEVAGGAWTERLAGGAGVWGPFAVVALCWLPYLLAYYPGSLSWDATNQLNMFFGVETWYNNHPVFSTLLMGVCVSAGRGLGSDNLGLFIYVLLQSGVLAFACAYSVRCMARWGAHPCARALALGFFALVPIWPFFAQWVVKDTLYIALALIFACRVMDLCLDGERAADKRSLAALALLGALCCLLRKNGVLLILPSLLALIPVSRGRRGRLGMAAAAGAVAAFFCCWNYLAVPAMGIGGESPAELLSIPLQQTARYVRDYGQEVTAEERAAIEGVLKPGGFDALGESYSPRISDPVKNLYDGSSGGEERRSYMRAWLSMAAKRPLSALEATVANTYAYYCPDASRDALLFFGDWIEANPAVSTGFFDFAYPDGSQGERAMLRSLSDLAAALPPTWLCYSQGAFAWLLLAGCFLVCVKRRPGLLAGMAPAIATAIMCLLSSVNGEYRYFMPVIASAPMLCAGVLRGLRQSKREDLT